MNLIAVARTTLQALECQRDANRVVALLGGKRPHIQNSAVVVSRTQSTSTGLGVLNSGAPDVHQVFPIDKLSDFVEQVLIKVDTAVIAAFYPNG